MTGSIKKNIFIWAFLTACITFAVYTPALKNGFVNWDDNVYVYEQYKIRTMGADFFRWIFSFEANPTWHPLTLFSIGIDYQIWELNPLGYHLTSVILHVLNTFLVFLLVTRLFAVFYKDKDIIDKKAVIAAMVTALLFGIHPLHVESVAWVSERKDLLYAFFYLLAILAYLEYASASSKRVKLKNYFLCLILFILSLLSKPMAVTLPAVLLILDYFPLQKSMERKEEIKKLIVEKIPFFGLSLLFSVIAVYSQEAGGTIVSQHFPLYHRVLAALHGYSFYILNMINPSRLAPFYPFPKDAEIFSLWYLTVCTATILVTFFCVWNNARRRLFASIWIYYVTALLPVTGLIKVGGFAAADRYTYLPGLGPFFLLGLAAGTLFEKFPRRRTLMAGVIVLISGILANGAVKQIGIWRDSLTLWNHEIRLYPNAIAHYNRGNVYNASGDYRKAIVDYTRAIELEPEAFVAYVNRGTAYTNAGDYREAITDFSRAMELDPQAAAAYSNRGNVYSRLGDYGKAIIDFTRAIELDPLTGGAYYNRGLAYNKLEDYQKAISDFSKAIELNPRDAKAYNSRGNAYFKAGDHRSAIRDILKAVDIDPGYARGYYNLGTIYSRTGDAVKGSEYYKKAAALGFNEAAK